MPLVAKLVGANLLVVGLLTAVWLIAGGPFNGVVILVLGAVVGVHLGLALIALRPIRDLETVATHVWNGNYGVRVERSAVADQEVLRVGSMFNILLDGLAADRAKMRLLAAEVIAAGDRERVGARARAARFRGPASRGGPASTLGRGARLDGSGRRRALAARRATPPSTLCRRLEPCRTRCIRAYSTTSASRRRFASSRATRPTGTAWTSM